MDSVAETRTVNCSCFAAIRLRDGVVPRVTIPVGNIESLSGVTFFAMEVRPEVTGDPWQVLRRYTDFRNLLDRLGLCENSMQMAPFPKKFMWMTSERLESRRSELIIWLQRLLEIAKERPHYELPLRQFLHPNNCLCMAFGGCSPRNDALSSSLSSRQRSLSAISSSTADSSPRSGPPEDAQGFAKDDAAYQRIRMSAAPAAHSRVTPPEAIEQNGQLHGTASGLRHIRKHVTIAAGTPHRISTNSPADDPDSSDDGADGKRMPFDRRRRAGTFELRGTLEAAIEQEAAERRSQLEGWHEWAKIIARDVPRTFPGIPQVDIIRMQLGEVLRWYAQADPELGYTQGMSFAAAIVCICAMKENGTETGSPVETKCIANDKFASLMKNLRELWLPGFPMVVEGSPIFEQLLEERDPELTAHLEFIKFNFAMVIPKIWLSLFAKWLPLSSLLEVVPFVGREGLVGVLLVTLLFIIYHRWFLLQCTDFEEALGYLDEVWRVPPPEGLVEMCTVAMPGFRSRLRSATGDSPCSIFLNVHDEERGLRAIRSDGSLASEGSNSEPEIRLHRAATMGW